MEGARLPCISAQMTDWDDLRFVLAAAREGGFSGAARALGVNHATVSRRIAGLEARLGVRLFDRLPRGIVPTAAGERALETARRAEAEMLGLAQDLAGRDRALAGPLTVTAPQLLIAVHLAGVFAAYGARHPGVELTVNASNAPLNLHRREADVAIRVSNAPEDTLVGRRASGQRRAFYLARGYLDAHRAAIEAPGAETGLDCLAFQWWEDGVPEALTALHPRSRVAMRFDDMVALHAAVRAGAGVGLLPCFLGDSDADLIRLPGIEPIPYLDIWVVTHPSLRRVPRVRAFMAFVGEAIRARAALYTGESFTAAP